MPEFNQNFANDILKIFFTHQFQLKTLHFQTKKYGAHKTIDKYLDEFSKTSDKFMEVAQGIVGKINVSKIDISFDTINDENCILHVQKFIDLIRTMEKLWEKYHELVNIQDEIIGNAQQLKYLLTFQ